MVYAGDTAIQYPVKDLYDKAIMQMSIAAAKDMYEKGQQQIKDFYKEYGDFISPIQKDMDWYNQNVTGRVRDTINNLYANGIDPLRSAEGRAAISQLIYSMPTGDIAKRRQSAKIAEEFLKNKADLQSKGLYDEDFERSRHGGLLLDDWDTGENGIWESSSPGVYQDYNTWTHHLFDDMELSYDEEETKKHPGYLAYTKNRDTMNKIVDTNIAALLNSDLGKYRLQEILDTIPENVPNRQDIAIQELKRRVVDSNYEQNRVKLEQDPYALARYQNRLRGSGGGSRRQKQTGLSFNWMNGIFQRGLTYPFGYDPTTGEEQAIDNIMSDQIGFGRQMARGSFNGPWAAYKALTNDYTNKFTIYEEPQMFAGVIGRKMDNNGAVPLTRADLNNLRTSADVVTSTYGYPYPHIATNRDKLKQQFSTVPVITNENSEEELGSFVMVPYRDVYTSYQNFGGKGAVDQQWKVAIIDNQTGDHVADYWYTIPNTREYNMDVPRISEWIKNKDGRYEIPNDINGNPRGRAKAGINPKVRGENERASWATTGMWGVTTHPFNRDVTFNPEGVATSPYR